MSNMAGSSGPVGDEQPPAIRVVAESGSTNADLIMAASRDAAAWPHLSGLLARRQMAGRGRAGRTWTTGDGALTFSLVLRPAQPRERWGWLPLLAGVAVVQALQAQLPAGDGGARASLGGTSGTGLGVGGGVPRPGAGGEICLGLKWPNDVVHLGGSAELPGWGRMRKVAGILAETLTDGAGVVLGIGVNLRAGDLPVPWAGSADQLGPSTVQGAPAEPVELAGQIRSVLAGMIREWNAGLDPRELVTPFCLSLGEVLRARLPGGYELVGEAIGLAPDGGLRLRTEGGPERVVRAGDVQHVRPAGGSD